MKILSLTGVNDEHVNTGSTLVIQVIESANVRGEGNRKTVKNRITTNKNIFMLCHNNAYRLEIVLINVNT